MKKKMYIFSTLLLIVSFTTVYAATTATGNFSLTYGRNNRSSYATLEASYPYVKYTAQNSGNSTLNVTLSKKNFLRIGFTNVEVKRTTINGNNISYTIFGQEQKNKDYLITSVNDTEGSIANASYVLTSKSTPGNV